MILAQAFSRFVLDLDGVVWRGEQPLPGSPETVRTLREIGKRLCFVTNNSSELPETYAKRLAQLGADGDPAEVITSADATVRLIERNVPGVRGRACYVIGGPGLREAMRSLSVRLVDGDEGKDASLVVIGFDRLLSYDKLRIATLAIRAGAAFIASNTDATIPAPDGLWPGAGATVAALRTATGVDPPVAGKPQPVVLDIAEERLGGAPALVIGDRADTDVLAAQAKGWPSALVLTGASNAADLALGAAWPEFLLRRLSDVLEDLPHPTLRPAVGPDLPTIASLLHEGDMPAGAVRERVGRTLIAELDRRTLVATAAWEPIEDDIGLLRSVSVAKSVRGKGVGTLTVAGTLRAAAEAGVRELYLVTPDAEPFFARCGFTTVRREQLPEAVARHRQVTRDCPSTAAVMHLVLGR